MADVTDATFQTDVMDRSEQVPVVVDLWAPWCGPCRTLGPIIERVVEGTEGAVELVKVDIDQNPAIASAFGVQSIPLVVAIKNQKVVKHFLGALPEREVQEFVDSLLPSPQETEVSRLLAAGDEVSLERVLEIEPGHEGAILALAELRVEEGRSDEALVLLEKIPESAESRHVAAKARAGDEATSDTEIEHKLAELLDRVKDDDDARQEYLDLLELLGADDPRTAGFRRQLTARLF